MGYEYWKLVRDYSRVIFQDNQSEEKQEKIQQEENGKLKNKRDAEWRSVDWKISTGKRR